MRNQQETTRRALFGFVGLAGVAVAMPAVVVASMQPAPTGVYAEYLRALAEFNNTPEDLELYDNKRYLALEARYHEALEAIRDATPTTIAEFGIWLESVSNGDWWADRALEIVRDLAAREGR